MLKDEYNLKYSQEDYFNNRRWINEIYVKNLIKRSGLQRGSRVLDAGCGQGHFSYLLHKCGMKVLGIDLSEAGIHSARKSYEREGMRFVVGDVFAIPVSTQFDGVFTRSLSLYNTDHIEQIQNITRKLMGHIKQNGCFIFCYNANFNLKKQQETWKNHTLDEVESFFIDYPDRVIYFTSKVDCLMFGSFAFNKVFTHINRLASKLLGWGGEIICFIRK